MYIYDIIRCPVPDDKILLLLYDNNILMDSLQWHSIINNEAHFFLDIHPP